MQMPENRSDEMFMRAALEEALSAGNSGEVPVGAVIVNQGLIVSKGRNTTRSSASPLGHAELDAIGKACAHFRNERLNGCDIFVTKEPCTMCAGAIIHARIERVIIGTRDLKYGACGTVFDVAGNRLYNHVPELLFGVLEEECSTLLTGFFTVLRESKKRHQGTSDD